MFERGKELIMRPPNERQSSRYGYKPTYTMESAMPKPGRHLRHSASETSLFNMQNQPREPLRPASSTPTVPNSMFVCACCYDVMVQPTTLNCGHSFCRLCLARWWLTSKKSTCPGCRQQWRGFPNVNIILRNTMEKLIPEEIKMRKASLENKENFVILEEFEKYGATLQKSETKQPSSDWLKKGFFYGVVTTLGVIFIVQSISDWQSNHELLVYKPLARWKPEHVSQWLSELGAWAADTYSQTFLMAKINGYLLMGLTDESQLAEEPFNVTSPLHRKALMSALDRVKELGGKPPADLWEYKAVHQGLSLLLSYTSREFPRLTISGVFIFYYDEIFLPFVHLTCPGRHSVDAISTYSESISWEQWVEFIPKFIFLPYYLFAEFAYCWIGIHFETMSLTIFNCALLTMIEAKAMRETWRHGIRPMTRALKKQINTLLIILLTSIFWRLIPSIICELMFYISTYYSLYPPREVRSIQVDHNLPQYVNDEIRSLLPYY